MSGGQGIQSIADLTSQTRITTGDIPPPLVGTSTTVVATKLYLFGGRLVSSRRMTNDLYVLDLDTYHWTKQVPPPDSEKPPKPRYFHSANAYKNQLVIFGGMGHSRSSADGLCVLDDVSILDLDTMNWIIPEIIPSLYTPRPRYAHLASVTGNKLVVIGGQDMSNLYIAEINVLDMDQWTWTSSRPFEKHCGAYRSVAVSSSTGSSIPLFGVNQTTDYSAMGGDLLSSSPASEPFRRASNVSTLVSNGSMRRATSPSVANPALQRGGGPGRSTLSRTNSVYRLSYTLQTTEDNPNPIYLYSNYNFTDVKRELQLIFPPNITNFKIEDHSNDMTGNILPPGLRFPSGHILGHNLILAGTYLTPQSQTFSMWVLNLASLVWSRIETGTVFQVGSWNRGVLCEANNKFIVLGHRDRSLLEDYNHRQANFDHVAIVDMEAFGVYQPPAATFPPLAQDMGLSLLNEPNISDFDVQTSDGKLVMVNSSILSTRWPYFRELMRINYENVEVEAGDITERKDGEGNIISLPSDDKGRKIVQISPKDRTLTFAEPYPIVFAFLQFIYTDHLLTAEQHQPHILSQLLLIADMYDLPRLRDLATHALHQMLNMSTAALIYETAALSNQTGLQIRALKVMIAAKKMMQQQQVRAAAAPGNGGNQNGSQFRAPQGNSVAGSVFSDPGSESGYFPSGASALGSTWGNGDESNPMGSAFSGYQGAQSPGSRAMYGNEDGSRMSMYENQAYSSTQNFALQTPARTRQPSAFSTQSRPSYSSTVYPTSQTSSGSSSARNNSLLASTSNNARSGSVSSDAVKSNNTDGKKKKKQVDPDQLVKAISGMDKSPLSNLTTRTG